MSVKAWKYVLIPEEMVKKNIQVTSLTVSKTNISLRILIRKNWVLINMAFFTLFLLIDGDIDIKPKEIIDEICSGIVKEDLEIIEICTNNRTDCEEDHTGNYINRILKRYITRGTLYNNVNFFQ